MRDILCMRRPAASVLIALAAAISACRSSEQGGSPKAQGASPVDVDRFVCWAQVSGFSHSDSANGQQSAISWDEVDVEKFLNIGVLGQFPRDLEPLKGKARKLPESGLGDPSTDFDLTPATRTHDQRFQFTITHYTLAPGSRYLIRAADSFEGDVKCLATSMIKTLPEQ